MHWKQKSRISWLREGNKNTRFFKLTTLRRRAFNRISGILREDGSLEEDTQNINERIVNLNKNLLSLDQEVILETEDRVVGNIPTLIKEEENIALISPFPKEEIKSDVFSMEKYKALGPDAFLATFFQSFWHIVGKDVIVDVQEFQQNNALLKRWNMTFITLIPKIEGATDLKDFRPISLCNTIYKVITKVLANKLRNMLPNLILIEQDGFVKERHC